MTTYAYSTRRRNGELIGVVETSSRPLALSYLLSRKADFRNVDLRFANLSRMSFENVDLSGADFRGANLVRTNFSGADLRGAIFDDMDAYKVCGLHEKMLAAIDRGGSLDMSHWHSCQTKHCRAGWAVTLAGKAGEALELRVGSGTAGALITMSSCPWLEQVPDFMASAKDALKDIRRCADRERQWM